MARPSLVNTCFKFPTDSIFAAAALASSVKLKIASTSSCSASVLSSSVARPVMMFTTPSGKSLVSRTRSEEHTSELQSPYDLVCRLLLEKKKKNNKNKQ